MGRRIQVVVRLRPGEGGPSCLNVEGEDKNDVMVADLTGTYAHGSPRRFHVDRVISEDCSNEELFRDLVLERIRSSVQEPDTSCFLAYGHTSSGKTHTIAGTGLEAGLLSLSTRAVLDTYGAAEVAMLEVYGEGVHDLLAHGERRLIRRRSGPEGMAIVVENLTSCCLTSMEEWKAVSEFGMQTRRTAPTERNARSSRSHAIFTIKSKGMRLCLVDLAGSERQTTYSPLLNKETIAINKSLSRLSTVLEALSTARLKRDGSTSYVNFRDTTLTVLLQRYLSGASMTTFLACIHPDTAFYHETMSTMRYTQRLKRINTKNAPRRPSEDLSLFHPGEKQNLLAELIMLRKMVGKSQKPQRDQQKEDGGEGRYLKEDSYCSYYYHQNGLDHLRENSSVNGLVDKQRSDILIQKQKSILGENVTKLPPYGSEHRQQLLRSKDTMRVAGWLLSRILGELPELSIGFDDYFDHYLPPQIQVVGYISLVACLAPRSMEEAMRSLAFLDVGDIAMGLSMLDAGIPACVGLHKLNCCESETWMAHEYDGVNRVYVLAFFEINEHLAEVMGDTHDAFECCGGLLTLEPLVPLAIVLCTPLDASNELKENILQHLVTLQGEQAGVIETKSSGTICGSSTMSLPIQKETNVEDMAAVGRQGMRSLEEITQWRLDCAKDVITSSDTLGSPAGPLAEEIHRQRMNTSQLCSPFQEPPSLSLGDVLANNNSNEIHNTNNKDNCMNGLHAFRISSSSSFSSSFSSSSSSSDLCESSADPPVIDELNASLPSTPRRDDEEVPEVNRPIKGSVTTSESDTQNERGTPESIDAGDGSVKEVNISVSPGNVELNISPSVPMPQLKQSTLSLYPAQESTGDAFIFQESCSDDKSRRGQPECPTSAPRQVVVNDKKKRKYPHRKRKPVMEGCHKCVVL